MLLLALQIISCVKLVSSGSCNLVTWNIYNLLDIPWFTGKPHLKVTNLFLKLSSFTNLLPTSQCVSTLYNCPNTNISTDWNIYSKLKSDVRMKIEKISFLLHLVQFVEISCSPRFAWLCRLFFFLPVFFVYFTVCLEIIPSKNNFKFSRNLGKSASWNNILRCYRIFTKNWPGQTTSNWFKNYFGGEESIPQRPLEIITKTALSSQNNWGGKINSKFYWLIISPPRDFPSYNL